MAGEKILLQDDSTKLQQASDVVSAWTSNTTSTNVLKPDGSNGVNWAAASNGGFGDEYDYAISDSESNTTSTTYVTKLQLVKTDAPTGDYFVYYSYDTYYSDPARTVDSQLNISPIIGNKYQCSHSEGKYHSHHGFGTFNVPVIATVTIAIQYKKSAGGPGAAYIKNARIETWKTND